MNSLSKINCINVVSTTELSHHINTIDLSSCQGGGRVKFDLRVVLRVRLIDMSGLIDMSANADKNKNLKKEEVKQTNDIWRDYCRATRI